ncbi:hypothetical protein [Streptococcus acidominimus]|uniref:LPXTG cell wall anchor domain-containing protein n=1 Tax=Streptococcus acidominimus TaxID=1326 RepID=A0A4Y9FTF0_STRAI|nr:hypothetical protein [Streptococcus acidominimus]MBF0818075.1 hypothetical protein [Streptococcus acidominimus]MBF0838290.1 hypothetical protein [Streptococcus acidominimus]MBF0846491.1 hypothetical protein [Streptococcus danieliae]TFU31793.1 hypothetical protein E4U01_01200 [Streptococcus acidominimus]
MTRSHNGNGGKGKGTVSPSGQTQPLSNSEQANKQQVLPMTGTKTSLLPLLMGGISARFAGSIRAKSKAKNE